MLQGRPAALYWPMLFFTICGAPVITVGLVLLAACLAVSAGQLRLAVSYLFACVAMLIGAIIKMLLRRGRPKTPYSSKMWLKTYSFPSGHSFGSVIAYGYIAHVISSQSIALVSLVIVPFLFLIGYSRVYLGAHYALDVLGGWLIGVVSLVCLILFIG